MQYVGSAEVGSRKLILMLEGGFVDVSGSLKDGFMLVLGITTLSFGESSLRSYTMTRLINYSRFDCYYI
jgi:hypothetical protein